MSNRNGGGVIRVLVAATSTVRRGVLEAAVRGNAEFRLAASVLGLIGLAEKVRAVEADVALVDLAQPDAQFPSMATSLEQAGAVVVALIDAPDASWVARCLRSGVRAFLAREASAAEITSAIEIAARGMVLLDPDIARRVAASYRPETVESPLDGAEELTPREIEVLRMMAEGLGNKEIAAGLGISDHTVKFHISSILAKVGASSRTEAVTLGIRMGLIVI